MITPSEYRSSNDISTRTEARIDEAIRNCDHLPVRISSSLLPGQGLEYVLDSYRTLGWSVEYVYDSRDGDYVELDLP